MGWTRAFTPILTANVTGGMTVIEPSNRVQYQGGVSVEGKFQNTDASLSYSRGVYPSFFNTGLPLLSQVVTATVSHRVTALLTVTANGNYRSEEHTSELQSHSDLVCRLLLEKKKKLTT